MTTVRTQTGTRISRLGPATETKSDQSELIVRPVSCKRIKRNVWGSIRTHLGLSSSRSHVYTPLLLTEQFLDSRVKNRVLGDNCNSQTFAIVVKFVNLNL